jgi:peroxiredoxin
MKSRISLWIFVIAGIFSSCSSSEPHYVIKGKIYGAYDVTFLIQKKVNGKEVSIDSTVVKRERFEMKGKKIGYPELVMLKSKTGDKSIKFFLENSKITLTGHIDTLSKVRIIGSKSQNEYLDYLTLIRPYNNIYSQGFRKYDSVRTSGDLIRSAELEKYLFVELQNEIRNVKKEFIRNNPSSFVSPMVLDSISWYMGAGEIESFIESLDTNLVKTTVIKDLRSKIDRMRNLEVGKKAPDFSLQDLNGTPISMSSKIGTKLLLIEFWASWCKPCRIENPNLVKVYTQFHKKGFDVLSISLDQKKEDWIRAIKDDNLTWTHLSDLQSFYNNAAAKLYAVPSIPANFLLDENGIIIAKNLKGESLYNKISQTLGKQ